MVVPSGRETEDSSALCVPSAIRVTVTCVAKSREARWLMAVEIVLQGRSDSTQPFESSAEVPADTNSSETGQNFTRYARGMVIPVFPSSMYTSFIVVLSQSEMNAFI